MILLTRISNHAITSVAGAARGPCCWPFSWGVNLDFKPLLLLRSENRRFWSHLKPTLENVIFRYSLSFFFVTSNQRNQQSVCCLSIIYYIHLHDMFSSLNQDTPHGYICWQHGSFIFAPKKGQPHDMETENDPRPRSLSGFPQQNARFHERPPERTVPIGSMNGIFIPTWMVNFYGKCR